jgi:hypothetical protein
VPTSHHPTRAPPTPVNRRARSSPLRTRTSMPSRARAPHVPLPRVRRGQQRSFTSSVAGYPQIGIRAGQTLDRRPIFQAGHAGSIPVARSTPLRAKTTTLPDHGKGRRADQSGRTRYRAAALRQPVTRSRPPKQRHPRRALLSTCTCAHLLGSTPASFSSASSKAQATTSPIRPTVLAEPAPPTWSVVGT